MPRTKLTAKSVAAWQPTAVRQEISDELASGLYLVVQPSGAKSWALRYRQHGRNHKLTLGKYPSIALSEARVLAREHASKLESGAVAHTQGITVEEAAEQYITRRLGTLRTGRALERTIRACILPAIGDVQLTALKRAEIIEMLDTVAERAPVQANRVYALTRMLLQWSIERGLLEASPMAGVKKPTREQDRDRVLSDAELRALWRAFGLYGWPFGSACKLMLLTAQRRGEVSTMRWRDLDSDTWHLSAEQTKNGRAHDVPLSPQAQALIAELPRLVGDYVFRSMRGNFAATSWSQAKVRFDTLSGVQNWRIHDLRRTAATGMARCGVRPDVIKRVLNHSPGAGITAVYDRYSYAAEMREALCRWSDMLDKIVTVGVDGA